MSRAAGSRGAAAIEFAIVVPILLLILFAIVDFGRLFFVQTTLKNDAREVARNWVVASATNTAARDRANQVIADSASIASWSSLGSGSATWTNAAGTPLTTINGQECSVSGGDKTASVSVPFQAMLPVFFNAYPSVLKASTTMRCES